MDPTKIRCGIEIKLSFRKMLDTFRPMAGLEHLFPFDQGSAWLRTSQSIGTARDSAVLARSRLPRKYRSGAEAGLVWGMVLSCRAGALQQAINRSYSDFKASQIGWLRTDDSTDRGIYRRTYARVVKQMRAEGFNVEFVDKGPEKFGIKVNRDSYRPRGVRREFSRVLVNDLTPKKVRQMANTLQWHVDHGFTPEVLTQIVLTLIEAVAYRAWETPFNLSDWIDESRDTSYRAALSETARNLRKLGYRVDLALGHLHVCWYVRNRKAVRRSALAGVAVARVTIKPRV
jgi:hypothetical protein